MAEIRRDRIIEELIGADELTPAGPAQPPKLVRISGLVGDNAGGYTRLFNPDDLGMYIDIPTDSIRRVEPADREQVRPGEGSSVWVDPGAEINWYSLVQERFLAGEIASRIAHPHPADMCHGPRSYRWPP